jgi:hypothetical protein
VAARETAAALDATAARVLLQAGGSQHTLAAWPDAASAPRGVRHGIQTTPHRIVRTATLEPATTMSVEVLTGDGEFDMAAAALIAAAASVLRDLLARTGVRLGLDAAADRAKEFEQRLSEEISRAKRYDLALSVVVLRARQPRLHGSDLRKVTGMLKAGLRSGDVVGRVAPGALGIMLLHAPAGAAGKVVTRLEQRLTARTPPDGDTWGVGVASLGADCASPGAMIARALRDVRPVMPD